MDIKKYFNGSISRNFFLLISITVIPIVLILYFFVLPIVADNYLENRKKELQSVVESAHSLLETYDQKAAAGTLTMAEAQEQAFNQINALRYSGKEYYFAYDYEGKVLALGSAPEKKGENRYNLEDKKGFKFVKAMADSARLGGKGFVTYYYPKLGEQEALPKLSYVQSFDKWKCFVGSGLYIDDIETNVSKFKIALALPVAVTILLSIGLGVVLSRRISTSVKKITSIAETLSTGEIRIDIQKDSGNEIGLLQDSFQKMIINLRQQAEIADKIAMGDLNVTINKRSDNDALTSSMEKLVKNLRSLITEMKSLTTAAKEGKLKERGNPDNFGGGYREIVLGVNKRLMPFLLPWKKVQKYWRRWQPAILHRA